MKQHWLPVIFVCIILGSCGSGTKSKIATADVFNGNCEKSNISLMQFEYLEDCGTTVLTLLKNGKRYAFRIDMKCNSDTAGRIFITQALKRNCTRCASWDGGMMLKYGSEEEKLYAGLLREYLCKNYSEDQISLFKGPYPEGGGEKQHIGWVMSQAIHANELPPEKAVEMRKINEN